MYFVARLHKNSLNLEVLNHFYFWMLLVQAQKLQQAIIPKVLSSSDT